MDSVGVDFLPVDVYCFLGKEVRVRSNSEAILAHLRSMYGRFYDGPDIDPKTRRMHWEEVPGPGMQILDHLPERNELLIDDRNYLYRASQTNGRYYYTSRNLRTAADDLSGFCPPLTLIQSSLLRTIAVSAREHHFVHAGAVSWRENAVVFPAASGLGKTTLVLKLLSLGCKFLSDEVGCLDIEGAAIEPFPRKVNLRKESRLLLHLSGTKQENVPAQGEGPEQMLDIEEISPASLSDRYPLRFIVFMRGFGDEPRLEYVSGSHAVFEFLNSSIGPINDPGLHLYKLAPTINGARCFNLVMGELEETASLVMQLLDKQSL
ncbi:hypothetical protein HZA56_04910 [Candidatus Poribacteria bacterium]|nr:hypothetical protein [Candidatus Poribacteria bacterium]